MNPEVKTNIINFPMQESVNCRRTSRSERAFLAFWLVIVMGGSVIGGLLNLLGL